MEHLTILALCAALFFLGYLSGLNTLQQEIKVLDAEIQQLSREGR